ncbi:MAG: D-alanyl-D-alanine carboxypeptidase/D-alanyl-D-alanine endopeptidase, partial [Tepidisphaeraceae bacterium]
MKRLFGPILSIAIPMFVALTPAPARADLRSAIRGVLQDKLLGKAEVGVVAARLGASSDDVHILYTHNSDIPLIPASNLKVVTTAAALERLGSDFRFRTVALLRDGDLILWGDGDPTLGDAEMLKKVGWDVTTIFQHWADELKKRNITSVRDVIVDDSIFDETFLHPNWPEDQLHKRYVAEVGGMNLNANCLDFHVRVNSFGDVVSYSTNPSTRYVDVRNTCVAGNNNAIWLSRQPGTNDIILRGETPRSSDVPVSVTIHDPSMFATTVLAETIKSAGVSITGAVKRDRTTRQQFSESSPEEQKA